MSVFADGFSYRRAVGRTDRRTDDATITLIAIAGVAHAINDDN